MPVLLLAPGGMRSCLANWESQPYDPWTSLPAEQFQLIAMDQRTAMGQQSGTRSTLRNGDGWHTFKEDQLALLDHLGVRKCHLLGSCIGPSFALSLLRDMPSRFGVAVLMQPIGLSVHTTEPGRVWAGLNSVATEHWFGNWAAEMLTAGLAERGQLVALSAALFDGRDFVFSTTREEIQAIQAPLLVLMGMDIFHPSEISREITRFAPNAELIEHWRDVGQASLRAASERIHSFLTEHSGMHMFVPPSPSNL